MVNIYFADGSRKTLGTFSTRDEANVLADRIRAMLRSMGLTPPYYCFVDEY